MRFKVYLDPDTVDNITKDYLVSLRSYLKNDIKRLKKQKKLSAAQAEDLENFQSDLEHIEHVVRYFGG